MGFWKKRETSGSRRGTRLWLLRARQFTLFTALAGLVIAPIAYAWNNGAAGRAGEWALEKTMVLTADAGFSVKEILVTGRNHLPQEELLTNLHIKEGAPIFSVSVTDARESLEKISWITSATVERRLPDKIIVNLRERAPVARWQYQKNTFLIDTEGKTLTSSGMDAWKHLPLVTGENAPQNIRQILGFLQAEPEIAARLVAAQRVGGRRWDLQLKDGLLVKLPEKDAELALRQLAGMNDLLTKKISVVDLRVPGRLVVEPAKDKTKNDT